MEKVVKCSEEQVSSKRMHGILMTFNLKKEWFEKIQSGVKTTEYREFKDFWCKRTRNALGKIYGVKADDFSVILPMELPKFVPCRFVLGYTSTHIDGFITRIDVLNGLETDLKIDKDVFAFNFILEKDIIFNEQEA